MTSRWFPALLGAAMTFAAAARADDKAVEKPEVKGSDLPALAFDKSALDNGLELLVHTDKRMPLVCVSVWYHVGAFNEDAGKTGFAHLFEHMMFQGTPHIPGDNHIKFLEAAGASQWNGTTDFDRTNYFECVPKNELELALWLESDRMGWLMEGVDKAKLDEQRNVVKNERRQSVENQPYGLAEEKIWQAMFPHDHPYWGYVIGSMTDLDRASLDDVRKFYDTYYAPSNATLAVTGDIEAADAKKLVDKYFKTLPKWPKPSVRQVKAPALQGEVRVDFDEPVAQLAKVEVLYFAPPIYTPGDADMQVLAHVLGQGNGSHLHQALVVDGQLAQDVNAQLLDEGSVSVLTLSATVKPGVDPETVLNAIQAQIDLLSDIPPAADEIERSATTVEADAVFGLQNQLNRGEMLQTYNHYLKDPAFFEKDIARFRAVTSDSLLAAVKQYLGRDKRAVLVAKPKAPEAAKADAPKADAPKADPPKADAPKADAPKADSPKPDAPKTDAPAGGAK